MYLLLFRHGGKVCGYSSARTQSNKTSENKNAKNSSGSEIDNDNLQVGFTNTAITMGTNDEAGYTGLQRDLVGYQALKPLVYLEVLDSPIFQPRPALPPLPGSSIERQDDCGYTLPQIQSSQNILDSVVEEVAEPKDTLSQTESCPYEEIPDTDIKKERDSGYLHPLGRSDGDHKSLDVPASPRLTPHADHDHASLPNSEAELYVEMH